MTEHLYSFNGELRKQKKGGAIGNVLTGALATIFMIFWCKLFLEKVIEATTKDIPELVIHLLKVYVDDENVACEALPQGVRLIDGTVTVVESEIEIAQDLLIPADILHQITPVKILPNLCQS